LLQTYGTADAPQLPYGYPVMTLLALSPSLWRKYMNPRVHKWREMYYPEITDWTDYNRGTHPQSA
jgi:alkane 1-monooxygenase